MRSFPPDAVMLDAEFFQNFLRNVCAECGHRPGTTLKCMSCQATPRRVLDTADHEHSLVLGPVKRQPQRALETVPAKPGQKLRA